LLAGRAGDALLAIRRALDLAREHKERGHEAWSWRILGEIPLRSELEVPEAEEALQRALGLATELEMRPLMAHGRLGWALVRAGRPARGRRTASAAALTLFGELEMRFWAIRPSRRSRAYTEAPARLRACRLDLQVFDFDRNVRETANLELERLGVVRIQIAHDPNPIDAFPALALHVPSRVLPADRRLESLRERPDALPEFAICLRVMSVLNFSVILRS